MRPLFGVMLVPSTPINEERLTTSGILQDDARQCALAFGHALKGGRLRRLGDSQNHAGILHREEALGHDHVHVKRQDQRAQR